jgi:hypothetical protein
VDHAAALDAARVCANVDFPSPRSWSGRRWPRRRAWRARRIRGSGAGGVAVARGRGRVPERAVDAAARGRTSEAGGGGGSAEAGAAVRDRSASGRAVRTGSALHRPDTGASLGHVAGGGRTGSGRGGCAVPCGSPELGARRGRPSGPSGPALGAGGRAGGGRPPGAGVDVRADAAPGRATADVLEALAARRDLHLFLLHLLPALWTRSVAVPAAAASHGGGRPDRGAAGQPAARLPGGPRMRGRCRSCSRAPSTSTTTIPSRNTAETLLGRIQADVRADAGSGR